MWTSDKEKRGDSRGGSTEGRPQATTHRTVARTVALSLRRRPALTMGRECHSVRSRCQSFAQTLHVMSPVGSSSPFTLTLVTDPVHCSEHREGEHLDLTARTRRRP